MAVGAILEGVDPPRAPLQAGDDPRIAGEGEARGGALVGPVPGATVPVVDVQVAVGAAVEGVDSLRAPLHVGDDPRIAGEGRARGGALVGPVPGATVPGVDLQMAVACVHEGVDLLGAPLQVSDDPRTPGNR